MIDDQRMRIIILPSTELYVIPTSYVFPYDNTDLKAKEILRAILYSK